MLYIIHLRISVNIEDKYNFTYNLEVDVFSYVSLQSCGQRQSVNFWVAAILKYSESFLFCFICHIPGHPEDGRRFLTHVLSL